MNSQQIFYKLQICTHIILKTLEDYWFLFPILTHKEITKMLKCCKENVPSAQLYHYTMSHDIVQMPFAGINCQSIASSGEILNWDTTCVSSLFLC